MLNHEQLLKLIRDKIDHPATPRELFQRLKLPRDQRATFKKLLTDLVESGALVETRGNRYGLPDRINLVVGRVVTHPRGSGSWCRTARWKKSKGDLYIAGSNLNQAMHGDRVVARIERVGDDRAEGRILRVLERGHRPSSAVDLDGRASDSSSRSTAGSSWTSRSSRASDPDAKPGDMAVVEITRWPTAARGPLGRIIEVLGDIDEPGVDTQIIIRKYGIPDAHGEEAIEEARRIGGECASRTSRGRTDFRPLVDRDDRRRARARLRRRDHARAAAERQLLARRAHRRRGALRARGRRRSTRRRSSAARPSIFPSGRSTCSRRSSRPACAASTRTSIGWCSRA